MHGYHAAGGDMDCTRLPLADTAWELCSMVTQPVELAETSPPPSGALLPRANESSDGGGGVVCRRSPSVWSAVWSAVGTVALQAGGTSFCRPTGLGAGRGADW